MRLVSVLTTLAVAAAPGGCGAAHRSIGQTLFTQDCAVCHSLSGHQSPRRQGGDLRALDVDRGPMFQFVREMPVRHRLTPAQVRAIADYVLAVEHGGRGS